LAGAAVGAGDIDVVAVDRSDRAGHCHHVGLLLRQRGTAAQRHHPGQRQPDQNSHAHLLESSKERETPPRPFHPPRSTRPKHIVGSYFLLTFQIVPLPSSEKNRLPCLSNATPTGRPHTSLSLSTKPVTKSV